MISVNELIQQACENLMITGLGESTDGNIAVASCQQLNRLISNLNNEGYLSLTQKYLDTSPKQIIYFRKLQNNETQLNTINMSPPEKIVGVARKIGERFIPLYSCDLMQLSKHNTFTIPTSWYYGKEIEDVPTEYVEDDNKRLVGVLRLDGTPHQILRIWYNEKIENYTLSDKIYLSDIYNELLISGLKYRLAQFFELSESKKNDCYTDFLAAKNLIKRNNITQRMVQNETILQRSYNDNFYNGFSPDTW